MVHEVFNSIHEFAHPRNDLVIVSRANDDATVPHDGATNQPRTNIDSQNDARFEKKCTLVCTYAKKKVRILKSIHKRVANSHGQIFVHFVTPNLNSQPRLPNHGNRIRACSPVQNST